MSPHTIRGWFTVVQSWRGQDGTRIPEFGLAVRTSASGLASESVGTAVLDGVGGIGDSIGAADTHSTTAAGTTQGAGRFITEAISIEEQACAAGLTVSAVELTPAALPYPGLLTGTSANAAEFTTVPEPCPGLSTETPRRLEDTPNRAVKAASAQVLSAATGTVDRPGAFPHAEGPAWVAEHRVAAVEHLAAEEAGGGNRRLVMFRVASEI
jgi:hypothetical protein